MDTVALLTATTVIFTVFCAVLLIYHWRYVSRQAARNGDEAERLNAQVEAAVSKARIEWRRVGELETNAAVSRAIESLREDHSKETAELRARILELKSAVTAAEAALAIEKGIVAAEERHFGQLTDARLQAARLEALAQGKQETLNSLKIEKAEPYIKETGWVMKEYFAVLRERLWIGNVPLNWVTTELPLAEKLGKEELRQIAESAGVLVKALGGLTSLSLPQLAEVHQEAPPQLSTALPAAVADRDRT